MDQSNDALRGELLHGAIKLQTNDFPIDLTQAEIHKYVIKFSPKSIPTKEKRFLARRFVSQLMLSRNGKAFIYDDKFEILLPRIDADLSGKALKAVYFLKKKNVKEMTASLSSSSHGTNTNSMFLTDFLSTRTNQGLPSSSEAQTEEGSVQIRVVFAEMVTLDMKLLGSRLAPSDPGRPVVQEQRQMIHALNKVLLREAHDTSSVYVDGDRLFDMEIEPIAVSEGIELRRGVVAESCIVNSSIVRRITPCAGFFLKEMELGELLQNIWSWQVGAPIPLETEKVNQLLKGLRVRKTYGNQGIVRVIGLMAGNPDQETIYWNNNKPTTISNYLKKGKHNRLQTSHPSLTLHSVSENGPQQNSRPELCACRIGRTPGDTSGKAVFSPPDTILPLACRRPLPELQRGMAEMSGRTFEQMCLGDGWPIHEAAKMLN